MEFSNIKLDEWRNSHQVHCSALQGTDPLHHVMGWGGMDLPWYMILNSTAYMPVFKEEVGKGNISNNGEKQMNPVLPRISVASANLAIIAPAKGPTGKTLN